MSMSDNKPARASDGSSGPGVQSQRRRIQACGGSRGPGAVGPPQLDPTGPQAEESRRGPFRGQESRQARPRRAHGPPQWRPGLTLETLQAEMDAQMQFPGFPNVWTQPIRNRLDMLLTGIKTPVGIKVLGADLNVIQRLGQEIEGILKDVPGTRSVYAERVAQGYFTDIRIDRDARCRRMV